LSAVDGRGQDVSTLTDRLGLSFDDLDIVVEAMSHRSWCAENPGQASYERLEFLGDAVLGWVTADVAYRHFPEMSEGQLTGIRKGVVNTVALAELAAELGIGPYIRLGKGEAAAGGSSKPSILADAMEALIGAIYLDRGSHATYEFVERLIVDRVVATAARLDELDFKTTLQELVAAAGLAPPLYDITEQGPDHQKRFFATVSVGGAALGTGEGSSKRSAEQGAAAAAARTLASERDDARAADGDRAT
jgi:ribonuclease-3